MVHIAPVLTGSHIYGIASQDRMSSFVQSRYSVLQIFSFMTIVNQQEQEHNLPVNRAL
jgi:hypothetical protein